MTALTGVKVLDASQIMAGPYCTMVLADLGAEVIKIEKINGGDDSRQMGPYVNGESTCFFQINRNKKSVALNLKTEEGKRIFNELAKEADIIVENYRPGVTKSLGIDYESMKKLNEGIVYCSISGFGQTGPYSHKGGFDLVAQGMTGLMSMTGLPGGRPLKSGVAVYDIGAGITAAYGILAAYIHKLKTGKGQQVDISLAECGLPWFAWEAAAYFANGVIPEPSGWRHRVSAPYQAIKAKDAYMMIGCANQRTWEKFCLEVLNKPEWLNDERYKTNSLRHDHVEELEREIEEITTTRDASYWINKCEQAGVPSGPINNFAEAVNNEHYLEREMVVELDHSLLGKMKTIGSPTKFSESKVEIKTPAPLLGEHTEEVLKKIGYSDDDIQSFLQRGIIDTQIQKENTIK
ncbi:CaiB/BaiF CoA transferase family protein [Robertmurraya sp. FSL R5-0851]|uniref:CaiB/BaiF CoA transferase family protein n=1 Tax=Robertmurraya sp. FSL R5-0851 TaxID=2921584 RepID=UPI0030F53793